MLNIKKTSGKRKLQIRKYCHNCKQYVHWRIVHWDHQDGYLSPEVHCGNCDGLIEIQDDIPKFEGLPK
jgi:hypothetical protein